MREILAVSRTAAGACPLGAIDPLNRSQKRVQGSGYVAALSKEVEAFVKRINDSVKKPDAPQIIAELWAKITRMNQANLARPLLSRKARKMIPR